MRIVGSCVAAVPIPPWLRLSIAYVEAAITHKLRRRSFPLFDKSVLIASPVIEERGLLRGLLGRRKNVIANSGNLRGFGSGSLGSHFGVRGIIAHF